MQLSPDLKDWLLSGTHPDPDGLEAAARRAMLVRLEKAVLVDPDRYRLRGLGDYEGHPFHGNQYTDVAGTGTETKTETGNLTIRGSREAVQTVQQTVEKLPEGFRTDLQATRIETYSTVTEANERINEYLLKHYGVTQESTARALTDRARGVIITTPDQETLRAQLAHALVHRMEEADWKRIAGEENQVGEFVKLVNHVVEAAEVTNVPAQLGKLVVEPAYHALLNQWGWTAN